MSDCNASCLITAPSFTAVTGCGLLDNIRSGFVKNFIALRCDETIPDITDDTAIGVQVSAGTVWTSPTLTGQIPYPTTGDELVENFSAPQPSSRTYNFNFESYRVDNTTLTDFTSWESVNTTLTTWFIAPVTCDNIILVPQDFTTDGIFFNMRGTISTVFANTNAMTYEGQLAFKYSQVLNGIQLSDAVVTALGLSVA